MTACSDVEIHHYFALIFNYNLRDTTVADASHKINMSMWCAVSDVQFLCVCVRMLYWPAVLLCWIHATGLMVSPQKHTLPASWILNRDPIKL